MLDAESARFYLHHRYRCYFAESLGNRYRRHSEEALAPALPSSRNIWA